MEIRPLSAALQKKAKEELNETPERIKTDIKILREWLAQQPHLQSVNPSDQWLVAFLRGSKYDIQKAKSKIDMYYTLKATTPEFFANRDPLDPGMQELLKLGMILPLKKYASEESPCVVLYRMGPFTQVSRPLSDFIKLTNMFNEIMLLEDDRVSVAGLHGVTDFNGIKSYRFLLDWTPSLASKCISCSLKALSLRLKGVHFLNGPSIVRPAAKLMMFFVGAKIRERIHWHEKDYVTLYDDIDKCVLPEEYGGTDGTIQELTDYWKAKMESYRDWFIDASCSDESKRPKKVNNGIFNTIMRPFQSLEVD